MSKLVPCECQQPTCDFKFNNVKAQTEKHVPLGGKKLHPGCYYAKNPHLFAALYPANVSGSPVTITNVPLVTPPPSPTPLAQPIPIVPPASDRIAMMEQHGKNQALQQDLLRSQIETEQCKSQMIKDQMKIALLEAELAKAHLELNNVTRNIAESNMIPCCSKFVKCSHFAQRTDKFLTPLCVTCIESARIHKIAKQSKKVKVNNQAPGVPLVPRETGTSDNKPTAFIDEFCTSCNKVSCKDWGCANNTTTATA